jgi:hypothetical protein
MDVGLAQRFITDVLAHGRPVGRLAIHPRTWMELSDQLGYLSSSGGRPIQREPIDLVITFPERGVWLEPGCWILI